MKASASLKMYLKDIMDETSLIRKEKSQKKLDDKASTDIKVKKKGTRLA